MPPHAPVVMEPLSDVSGYEGSRVELTCKLSGKPSPKILWYHNGDEISEDKKYHMLYKDNYASLLIHDLETEDAGKYRCKAEPAKYETRRRIRISSGQCVIYTVASV